ncbi:E3 ubiquitin-protein ligase RAD18 isoform X1 [Harpegnathos saltator]|uniref:E3 ubiquitin-protein ligase RAD18 isoform X1 n=2 Tax=Harpegnathos saltator TaxID=610380 RepID=UPI000DBEE150|nr:E3 ubiquitin-protein ligase RAD18 isoform X1 [Harpegnathos saltator]
MWPTKYMELKNIEELLTCGICYEYLDTSVVTLCSHNYCSFCIRKYLHYKTQCPTCSVETFEKDLRKNNILDEIIVQYKSMKEKLKKEYHKEIEAVKDENSEDACSVNDFECKKEIEFSDAISNASGILSKLPDSPLQSTAIISTPHAQKVHKRHQDVSSPSTSLSSKIPSMFTPKSKKSFRNENCKVVECPVCKVDVSENNINKHLDDCLKRESTKDQPKKVESKRKPLAKLVLSLMKDSAMRKKLKEFGLSSQGDKKILRNRLQRYIVLYNAECDKVHPRPVSELIKQCEEEENLEKNIQKPSNRLNVNRNMEQNIIEQQREIYLRENKGSFDQLISKIKTAGNSRKLPIKRNILSAENFDSEDCRETNIMVKDSEKNDLTLMNSYIDDSDSNTYCPLQTYSSENPVNFLSVELSSSSDDNSNRYVPASKQNTSNVSCNINLSSVSSTMKTENLRTELSLEKTSIYKEIATHLPNDATNVFHTEERDILENRADIHTKESHLELTKIGSKGRKEAELFTGRNRDSVRYNQKKHDIHLNSADQWEEELRHEITDSIVRDIKHETKDIDDAVDQLNEESKQQLIHNVREYVPDRKKFEKENMKTADEKNFASVLTRSRDNINVLRKRERDMTLTLSDDERIGDRSISVKKSARFGLSETVGFNNGNFGENTLQVEEESQEKVQSRATCAKSINTSSVSRSTRLRSKINSNRKK